MRAVCLQRHLPEQRNQQGQRPAVSVSNPREPGARPAIQGKCQPHQRSTTRPPQVAGSGNRPSQLRRSRYRAKSPRAAPPFEGNLTQLAARQILVEDQSIIRAVDAGIRGAGTSRGTVGVINHIERAGAVQAGETPASQSNSCSPTRKCRSGSKPPNPTTASRVGARYRSAGGHVASDSSTLRAGRRTLKRTRGLESSAIQSDGRRAAQSIRGAQEQGFP